MELFVPSTYYDFVILTDPGDVTKKVLKENVEVSWGWK